MPMITALIQKDLLKHADLGAFAASRRATVFDVHDPDFPGPLAAAERMADRERIVPLVSIQVARRIERDYPHLARSLVFSPGRLAFHLVAAQLGGRMLNEIHLLLPWAHLPRMLPALRTVFGDALFIRPDSALKPFTGFAGDIEQMQREHAALTQTDGVAAGELCVIAAAAALDAIEWRFWVVDGALVTWAAYSWADVHRPAAPSPEILAFAREAAAATEAIESAVVMDIGVCDRGPRVLELNPVSTSGLYPGCDLGRLLDALAPLFPA